MLMTSDLTDYFIDRSFLDAYTQIDKLDIPNSGMTTKYSINFNNKVVTLRNNEASSIEETNTLSNSSPSVNFNNSKDSVVKSRERSVEFDWFIPRKLDNKSMRTVIGIINDEISKVWRTETASYAFDIDIKLEIQKNIESKGYEVIYTVFIPNLYEKDIPKVWNNLRKTYNRIIESNKRKKNRYRDCFNTLAKITYIQLDW